MSRDDAEDQPRPALGRRPWFALLRRARSLRRFALAMGGSLPTATPYPVPVALASTRVQRLAGIHGLPPGWGLLLRGRSVHGRGLSAAITLVWLDDHGAVLEVTSLAPRRMARHPAAAWALELPPGSPALERGDVVSLLVPSSAP